MKKNSLIILASLLHCALFANTILVTDLNDSGLGTLREAVLSSNDGDTINFSINLLQIGNDSILLNTEIAVDHSLTINGIKASTDTLFISGQNSSRIFNISNQATVILNDIYIVEGYSTAPGGAIFLNDTSQLILNRCHMENSRSESLGGCIIALGSSSLDIHECKFSDSFAKNQGAFIHVSSKSTLELTATSLTGGTGDSTLRGGAIYSNDAFVLIDKITIDHCSSFQGGAIYSVASTFEMRRSTINANDANTGGALFFTQNPVVRISNSTVTGNLGSSQAGGLYTSFDDSLFIVSSILALNHPQDLDVNFTLLISEGYNIFSDTAITGSVQTDFLGVDSLSLGLGQLANNGGFTRTMAPMSGSIAIDMGNPNDTSGAQNTSISGIRDIGAAENILATNIVNRSNHEIEFHIYPNPIVEEFSIITAENNVLQSIDLIDIYGKLHKPNRPGRNTYKIDGPPGTYFIRFRLQDRVYSKKVIKM
ncbi:MAG: T9SS type A sorting domain-containing protein [Flavobacteriales bacterium]|nr:T9SS type A sorting domain-containing protein [Flavobacteriales bacterium]